MIWRAHTHNSPHVILCGNDMHRTVKFIFCIRKLSIRAAPFSPSCCIFCLLCAGDLLLDFWYFLNGIALSVHLTHLALTSFVLVFYELQFFCTCCFGFYLFKTFASCCYRFFCFYRCSLLLLLSWYFQIKVGVIFLLFFDIFCVRLFVPFLNSFLK